MFRAERDPRISFTVDGKMEITLTCDKSVIDSIEALKGKELQVEIKPYSKKRTMTQNSYLWALIGELARKLGITKDECYREFVRDYGVYEIVPIKNEAKERFIRSWQAKGLGWICEELRESKLDGYTNLVAYYGTSTYTAAEMAGILDAVIDECNAQGIATLTEEEAKRLRNENV